MVEQGKVYSKCKSRVPQYAGPPPRHRLGTSCGAQIGPLQQSPTHSTHYTVQCTKYTSTQYTQYIAQHFHLIQSIAPPTYRVEFLHI